MPADRENTLVQAGELLKETRTEVCGRPISTQATQEHPGAVHTERVLAATGAHVTDVAIGNFAGSGVSDLDPLCSTYTVIKVTHKEPMLATLFTHLVTVATRAIYLTRDSNDGVAVHIGLPASTETGIEPSGLTRYMIKIMNNDRRTSYLPYRYG